MYILLKWVELSLLPCPTCFSLQAAVSILKQEYEEGVTLETALKLAVKVLNKTLDSTKLTSEKGRGCYWIYRSTKHYFKPPMAHV